MSDEKIYLETQLAVVNGGMAKIQITDRRAVLGEKTYSLQNIAAVETFSNRSEIDEKNSVAEKAYEEQLASYKDDSSKTGPIVGALIFFGIGLFMAIENGEWVFPGVCCFLPGTMVLGSAFQKKKPPSPPAKLEPWWSVRIDASGTSTDVIQSLNEAEIRKVVEALNDAIIKSNS